MASGTTRPIEWISDARGLRIPRAWWPETRAAPDRLELVRQFVNTVNLHSGADLLGSATETTTWLRERGRPTRRVTTADVAELTEVRSILRELAIANATGGDAADLWQALTVVAGRHSVTIDFGGSPRLRATGTGVNAFIADVLSIVLTARLDGTWSMLKACPDQTCHWLIYDRTKNHSASWCSAGGCGARTRAKNYRARQRRS